MKYKVTYEYYNEYAHEDKEDVYSNNGAGYSLKEAIEIATQLSENGMWDIVVTEI